MTDGTKTALLVGGGIGVLFLIMNAKPKTTTAVPAGYATGTGGTAVALAGIGGAVSIIDSITGAIAGQQTSDASGASYGF